MNICKKHDIAFITMTNKGYIDFTLNCYKSLEKCQAKFDLVSHALDNDTFKLLSQKKYPAVFINDNKLKDLVLYKQQGWGTMMYTKMKMINEQLQKHKYVCLTDGDIVFNDNRFMEYCYNMISKFDIVFQNNSKSNDTPRICGGFVFIKSNDLTKKLYNVDKITKVSTEQNCLNGRIKKMPNLKVGFLPLELFPNGQYYMSNNKTIKPYMIHFNWIPSSFKVNRMKKQNYWYLQTEINNVTPKNNNTVVEFDINKTRVSKDVTDKCNTLLKDGVLKIDKNQYNKFFDDILKGKTKELYIEYLNNNGVTSKHNVSEKKPLKLSSSKIVKAIYYVKSTGTNKPSKFKSYINNWSGRCKSSVVDDKYLNDELKKYVKLCYKGHKGSITLHHIYQDKLLSYLFVKQFNWPIPQQYFSGSSRNFPDDLLKKSNIVVKATRGYSSKQVVCLDNGVDFFTEKKITKNDLIHKFNNSLIIAEEKLVDKKYNSSIPLDFKCFVFNGNVEFLCICQRFPFTSKIKKCETWYDKNLKSLGKLMNQYPIFKDSDKYLPTQQEFSQIKNICNTFKIFKNLFIRIDFYISKSGVLFGEFTPHPEGGCGYSERFLTMLDGLMETHKIR